MPVTVLKRSAARGETFVSDLFLANLRTVTRDQIKAVPHAVVRVDDSGTIELANESAVRMLGIPVSHLEGASFFRDVAPSASMGTFHVRFVAGVAFEQLDDLFQFTLRDVPLLVHLHRDETTATNWIFLQPE